MMRFLCLVWVALFGVRTVYATDLIDDELYHKLLDAQELEEHELVRSLRIEADGSLGSKCGLFSGVNKCDTGFECFHNRCIPNRDCMKERLQEFDQSFDSQAYKQQMFASTNVTEQDLIVAFRQSKGDEAAFVESNPMQSLIRYMQRHMEPFEPVTEIVDACSGIVTSRRLRVETTTTTTMEEEEPTIPDDEVEAEEEEEDDEEETTIDVLGGPAVEEEEQPEAGTAEGYGPKPSSSPSLSSAPSVSKAPSNVPSISNAPTRYPTPKPTRKRKKTRKPTGHPTPAPRDSTTYLGIHMEGGLVLELSLTAAWATEGKTTSDTLLRGCFGPTFGGGIELSFYVATAFDGLDNGWACGSMLFDTDVGLGLNLGMGLGTCFIGTSSSYLEYTIGAGVGAGFGIKVCGAQTLPSFARAADTVYARLSYMFEYGTDVWAPTTKELNGIIEATERFYTDVFAIAYPQSFESFRMSHVKDTFWEGEKFPVVIDFQPIVVFRINRRQRRTQEVQGQEQTPQEAKKDDDFYVPDLPNIVPAAQDVVKVMKWANYNRYVKEYVKWAKPKNGLFSNTKKADFKGSPWKLNSLSTDSDDDDDDHHHYDDDDDHHPPHYDDDDDDHHPPHYDDDDDDYHHPSHSSDDDDDHHHPKYDDDDDDDDYYSDDDDDDDDDDYFHDSPDECSGLLCF